MADRHRGVVAIVDDDAAVLHSLKLLLEVTGYTVDAYASAGAFLEDRAARPSCLILDLQMPMMTGLELVARLRTERADIPVLLVTAQPSPTVDVRAHELGIEKVLEKPHLDDDLISFVEAHA